MSLQTQTNYNSTPTHIYYDINVINNDKKGTGASVPVVFTETRNDVILRNPSEYFMTVTRFTLDTPSLPLFCPLIDTSESNITDNINKTIYKIAYGLGKTASNYDTTRNIVHDIIFKPQDLKANVPTFAQVQDNNIRDYYYIYSYQAFIDMINASFLTEVAGDIGSDRLPFWIFDKATNKAKIAFPQPTATTDNNVPIWGGDYDTSTSNTQYYLYLNAPLYNLFSSFQAEYVETISVQTSPGNFSDDNGGWYRLTINPANKASNYTDVIKPNYSNVLGINTVVKDTAYPFHNNSFYNAAVDSFTIFEQDYPTTPLWNPVQAIVFTTALMPIQNELIASPQIYNDTNLSSQLSNTSGNNRNFAPVLTDIEVPLTKGDETKPTIYYAPTAEYRLTDLQSNNPINNIQVSISWRDNYGTLHPFLLDAGCTSTLKILFRKKIFNLPSL
jgi:hypothetical protein